MDGRRDGRARKTRDDQLEEYGILEIKIFGGNIVIWLRSSPRLMTILVFC